MISPRSNIYHLLINFSVQSVDKVGISSVIKSNITGQSIHPIKIAVINQAILLLRHLQLSDNVGQIIIFTPGY